MIKTNRLDAGPVDSPVTASSTEESGDILPFFFVGRALAVNGGTNIVYTRDLADKGVPISVKMTPTTTGSYVRWMFPRTYGRFVVRRAFMRTEELTGPLTLIEVRHGVTGATVGRLQLTAEGEPVLTVGITRHLATRGQVIPLNTLVWVEYAINTDTKTAEYRITDNEGAVLSSKTYTNSGYLTGPVSDVRFGSTVDQWQAVDYIAGIQAGSLASGWLGPISQSVPLPTPRPWVTRVKTPTLGQTDGEISIAWYPVYGAASYRVVLDDDEILPVTGNTHTFTGVPPGEHRISVQAIAGPPPPRAVFVHELTGSNLAVDATKTTGAVSYAWAFGDGETSTQGPTTTHTYAAPGTYKVTLAVSDSMGRTSTFSRLITIEAAEIPNAAPTAAFSTSVDGLVASVDGSTSTDSDGAVTGYSWNWGDGTPATSGRTASHTYGAAGDYTVTLTVTDNRGGTATTSQDVTVTSLTYVASDDFNRSVVSGWGAADIGGVWTALYGAASAGAVDGSTGKITLSPGNTRYMALRDVSLQDTESSVQFSLSAPPSDGHAYVGISARQSATQKYDTSVWMRNDGSVWLLAEQTGTLLTSKILNGVTWTNGEVFNLKTRVTGSSPTTIEAKFWKEGSVEPTSWQLTTTDSTSGLQGEGYASLSLARSGSATQPTTVSFDSFRMVNLSVSPARHPADWDDANLPWSYATTDAFTEGFTEGITWTDLYTGTFAQSDLWSRITYTIAQVPGNGRVYVRIPTGVHNVTSFQTPFVIPKDPLYAFGLWFPRLSGLLGDGPDKTRIHLVANSYSQEQLDALATLDPDTFTPLGNAFARFDGAVTPFLLGGIKFTAADQQNVTALHPNMAAKHGIVVPQPAPHVGIHFEPAPSNGTSEFIVNNCAFVGCARALLGQPPFECGLINSQYTKSVFRRCDFDGRRDAEVDPLRPRRSTTALVNNEKDMSFVDCHFHHSNIGRFAGNDQNRSPAALSTFYNFIRCKFDHMGDEGNTDPLINGGAPLGGVDTRYISPFGFESTNARIRLTDCIITQNTTYARGGIAITQVGRNPSGGRMEVVDCVFRYEHKPYLNGFATMMIDPSTPWYTDGPATTTSVSREETPLTCHVYPTGSSWPPTEAYITAQGLTPETHYIVRRY